MSNIDNSIISNTSNHEPVMKSYRDYKRIQRDILLTHTDKFFLSDILKDPVKQQQITDYKETLRNYCNILNKIEDPQTLYSCNLPIPPFNLKLPKGVKDDYNLHYLRDYI